MPGPTDRRRPAHPTRGERGSDDQLRGATIPIELELAEGELRLAVEKAEPNIGSWQMVASPGRLLAMTERGASQREAQRTAELGTLRSAYQRLAERLIARASDRAALLPPGARRNGCRRRRCR